MRWLVIFCVLLKGSLLAENLKKSQNVQPIAATNSSITATVATDSDLRKYEKTKKNTVNRLPNKQQTTSNLAIGLTWPGIMVRHRLLWDADWEWRFLTANSILTYAARLYVPVFRFGPAGNLYVAGEGGYYTASDSVYGYSAHGSEYGVYGGWELPLGFRVKIAADIGPCWIRVYGYGPSDAYFDWVANTAIYLRIW